MDLTTFRTRFTEFESDVTFPDARVNIFAEDATALVPDNCPNKDVMIQYLTAHFLSVAESSKTDPTSSSPTGGITKESIDGYITVEYANNSESSSAGQSPLSSTPYGQRYLMYKEQCGGMGAFIVC